MFLFLINSLIFSDYKQKNLTETYSLPQCTYIFRTVRSLKSTIKTYKTQKWLVQEFTGLVKN